MIRQHSTWEAKKSAQVQWLPFPLFQQLIQVIPFQWCDAIEYQPITDFAYFISSFSWFIEVLN